MAERKRKKLNKCPVCGGALYIDYLGQYSTTRSINRLGKEGAIIEKFVDNGPLDCKAIYCVNEDFATNYDLEVIKPADKRWEIETENGIFYLKEKPNWML